MNKEKDRYEFMRTRPFVQNAPITLYDYDPTQPLVSVIMPSYNYGAWTIAAIESICNQTYHNIEIILIDDGSTDDTRETIKRFRREVSDRFVYIEKENEGVVKTMNKALEYVHGEYVTIMASDDLLCPEKFAIQVDLLESLPHVDSVFCPQYEMNAAGEITGTRGFMKPYFVDLIGCGRNDPIRPPDKWDVAELVLGAVAHPFMPQSSLTRTKVFRALKGFDEQTELDDIDFNLRAALHGFIPRYHTDILHKVRIHGANASGRPWWIYNETIASLDRFYSQPDIPAKILKYRRYLHGLFLLGLAGNLRNVGNWREALVQYVKLLIFYPKQFFPTLTRYFSRMVRLSRGIHN